MFKSEKDKKAEIKSATKTAKRDISHAKRDIEKEIRTCDRQEKELTVKIQAAAKANRDTETKLLAKQLIQVRQSKERLVKSSGHMSTVSSNVTAMGTSAVLAQSMAQATEAMKTVNTIASPADTMKTIQAFELENDKMALKDESWDEMMDLFDGDGVAEESDNVVNQIMDELGLQMGSSMPVHPNTVFRSAASIDAEMDAYLSSIPALPTGSTPSSNLA